MCSYGRNENADESIVGKKNTQVFDVIMYTKFGKFGIIYCILIVLFISLLVITSTISSSLLQNNIKSTVETFKEEGTYPSFGIPWRKIVLDNYTDALMFNTALSINAQKPLESALLNKRYEDPKDHINQISNLEKLTSEPVSPNINYERYWHGYLVFMRPVFTIFSYETIRIINAFILYGGFSWLFILCWRKLGKKFALALLIGLISVDFFFIWKSLQFSNIFKLSIFSSIFLLLNYRTFKTPHTIFFIVGGLTAFMDLLTAPLISLGILLIISTKVYKTTWKDIVMFSFIWAVGYIGLWASKWILVQYLFSPNAIQTSFDQIINRTITEPDPNFTYLNTLKLNIFQLIGYDKSNKIIVLIAAVITSVFVLQNLSFSKKKLHKIIPLIVIAAIPYAWYLVAANHSYLHVWFTYRTQFISVFCLVLILIELIDWEKVNNSKENKALEFTGERVTEEADTDLFRSSNERYKFAAKFINTNSVVLDIASGTGYGSALLAKTAKQVVGVDIDKETIEYCKKTYKKENISFQIIHPFKQIQEFKNKFDVIVSFETIEHIEDYDGFLNNLNFYLKDGGFIIMSTPNNYYKAFPPSNPFHVYEFNILELYEILKNHFKKSKVDLYGQHQMVIKRDDKEQKINVFKWLIQKSVWFVYAVDKHTVNFSTKLQHFSFYKKIGRLQREEEFDASIYKINSQENFFIPRISLYIVKKV